MASCLSRYCLAVVLLNFALSSNAAQLPAFPLAVRNPYLSVWLPGSRSNDLPTAQAQFWTGNTNLGWSILAQVDGQTFTLFGAPSGIASTTAATQNSISHTSTHTTVTLSAGAASFLVDFFSPVSPANHLRQSLPFSYVTVTVSGNAGARPKVQILNTIDDSWTGGQGNLQLNHRVMGSTSMFNLTSSTETLYAEHNAMAAWGSVVLATIQSGTSTVSYQSGDAKTVFSTFVKSGKVNDQSPAYATGDLFAFAQDLGTVTASTPATFAVGQYRDNVVDYLGQAYVGFSRSTYDGILPAVNGFMTDYKAAYTESQSLDKQIQNAAGAISSKYAAITTAAVRQVFGAVELALPASNTADTSKVYAFLKEISTDGNVNTIDVIYPTFTILSVLSPDWIRLLLEPVVAYLQTGDWPHDYVVHDLGSHYPNAIGHNLGNAELLPLEVTGSFFIMAYAYQKITGDKSWAQSHAALFRSYADYLVNNGLYPISQLDTVDSIPASANQTNLAMTAAIGLNAYGAMTGQQNYSTKGLAFAREIYTNGLGTNAATGAASTHFTYNYGNDTSWGTLFNLWPDQYLGLNTFPAAAVSMQCAWYLTQKTPAGIPYTNEANNYNVENGMWDMWIAALCPDDSGTLLDDEYAFLTNGKNDAPFPDRFVVSGADAGNFVRARARPTLGSTFAMLAQKEFAVNWS